MRKRRRNLGRQPIEPRLNARYWRTSTQRSLNFFLRSQRRRSVSNLRSCARGSGGLQRSKPRKPSRVGTCASWNSHSMKRRARCSRRLERTRAAPRARCVLLGASTASISTSKRARGVRLTTRRVPWVRHPQRPTSRVGKLARAHGRICSCRCIATSLPRGKRRHRSRFKCSRTVLVTSISRQALSGVVSECLSARRASLMLRLRKQGVWWTVSCAESLLRPSALRSRPMIRWRQFGDWDSGHRR